MSTYFFKTDINSLNEVTGLKPKLDSLEQDKTIERWHLDYNHPEHLLEIETIKLSPDEVKHLLREAGVEAEFAKAPQAR